MGLLWRDSGDFLTQDFVKTVCSIRARSQIFGWFAPPGAEATRLHIQTSPLKGLKSETIYPVPTESVSEIKTQTSLEVSRFWFSPGFLRSALGGGDEIPRRGLV